jgi:hypothetical protein
MCEIQLKNAPCTPSGCIELLDQCGVDLDGKNAVVLGRSNIVGMPMSLMLVRFLCCAGQCFDRSWFQPRFRCTRMRLCLSYIPGRRTSERCVVPCNFWWLRGEHAKLLFPQELSRADVVVAAIGKPEFVKAEWIKPGAVVIDVGINVVKDPSTKSGTGLWLYGWESCLNGFGSGVRMCGDVDFAGVVKVASKITPVPRGVGPMTVAMLMQVRGWEGKSWVSYTDLAVARRIPFTMWKPCFRNNLFFSSSRYQLGHNTLLSVPIVAHCVYVRSEQRTHGLCHGAAYTGLPNSTHNGSSRSIKDGTADANAAK